MSDLDDRGSHNPDTDYPAEFWDIIHRGEQNPVRFRSMCLGLPKDQLGTFLRDYNGLASFFLCPPFTLHLAGIGAVWCSEDTLHQVARLLISQGKSEVLKVWNHPEAFGSLVKEWLEEPSLSKANAKSYEFIAQDVWAERFGEEEIPF
jgi:hypothetical protein